MKHRMRKDVTLRAEELTREGHLTRCSFAQPNTDFPEQNLKRNFVVSRTEIGRNIAGANGLITQEGTLWPRLL